MDLTANGITKAFFCGALALLLAGCNGGDGDKGGNLGLTVTIDATNTTLPANIDGIPPSLASPFTTSVIVRAKRFDGSPVPNGTPVQLAVDGVDHGAISKLDDPGTDIDEFSELFGTISTESASGQAQFFFTSFDTPGVATLTASASDPLSGRTYTARTQITVGPGVSTGYPAQVRFHLAPTSLYISGQGRQDVTVFTVAVLDDAGQVVPNPTNNNLRVSLLPGQPNSGEKLVAVGAGGDVQEGEVINVRTINGIAQIALHSGDLPGIVRIAAVADRADNNVDNGIDNPVTDILTLPIADGRVFALTFAGPFVDAVNANANNLDGDPPRPDGTYNRLISVIANDRFGNVVPIGTPVSFRLIDAPLSGYPNQGRGTFAISGLDGNPEENGNMFRTPEGGSSLAGIGLFDTLAIGTDGGIAPSVVEALGLLPDQVGFRTITGILGQHELSVEPAFNARPDFAFPEDTGFTVPFVVGRPLHGNIEGIAFTDENGVATARMNYPASQLGRRVVVVAEADGFHVGAVMNAHYLGITDGSRLALVTGSSHFIVNAGTTVTETITLELRGAAGDPLPGEVIAVAVAVSDPAKTEAAAARTAAEAAQAAATMLRDPGDCHPGEDDPPTRNPELCALFRKLQTDAVQARADAEAARIKAARHNPRAEFSPQTLITGANGRVSVTLSVRDLPPDGRVEFFFSPVEVPADTVKVTFAPQAES